MKLIVGLGNPGKEFQLTRHNLGFLVIDHFSTLNKISLNKKGFKSCFGKGKVSHKEVILAKPLTFMNLSGEAVKELLDFFKLPLDKLLVIHDDMDLALGKIKIKEKGGDGGHKGVGSIIDSLKSENFCRLKIGIGRPLWEEDSTDYVLSPFLEEESLQLKEVVKLAGEAINTMVLEGIAIAMNRLN